MKCSKCGFENVLGVNFCAQCGQGLFVSKISPKLLKIFPKLAENLAKNPNTYVPLFWQEPYWTIGMVFAILVLIGGIMLLIIGAK